MATLSNLMKCMRKLIPIAIELDQVKLFIFYFYKETLSHFRRRPCTLVLSTNKGQRMHHQSTRPTDGHTYMTCSYVEMGF